MSNDYLESLKARIHPLQHRLLQHALYEQLQSDDALRTFMQYHAVAVWDFMWLLKKLQQMLTCVDVAWRPPANPAACRLINEIVLAEESDIANDGRPASHFELYLEAMQQSGAPTGQLIRFMQTFRGTEQEVRSSDLPEAAQAFLTTTLRIIGSSDACQIAAAFTFGRENLLPDVFEQIVSEVNQRSAGRFDAFIYYLNRHIELDGDEHGDMAIRLVADLCGDDPHRWQRATEAAVESLEARLMLWDAIEACLLPGAVR